MEHRTKDVLAGIVIAAVAYGISIPLSGVFDALERDALSAKYHLRGESTIDSSIVILYFDNHAVDVLGGFPLKRHYYALLIDALRDLGAKVIGVDVAFTEPDKEHPEYDQALSSIVRKSGNVVLGGYFRSLSDSILKTSDEHIDSSVLRFTTGSCGPFQIRRGSQLDVPFPELLDVAVGFGHTNLTDDLHTPLLIEVAAGRYLYSFGYAIARTSLDETDASDVPGDSRGDVSINYAGGLHSLNLVPAISFLKAYDTRKNGGIPSMEVQRMKGKIILVGFIAEGRSLFVDTPFESQFPSIGVHATFIHNLLYHNFLSQASPLIEPSLALVLGLLTVFLMLMRHELAGLLCIFGVMLLLIIVSYVSFSSASYILPIVRPNFVIGFIALGLLLYKHQVVKGEVLSLSEQKERVTHLLQKKESVLKSLEDELALSQTQHAEDRAEVLLAEVRKYKAEVSLLRSQAEDLKPFAPVQPEASEEAMNFNGIVYRSPGLMAGVVEFIKKIADNDATVLILGESGTGKELVARALHQESHRRDKPFVAVNCGALTETLLESELFGHEKGAFTGAVKEKPGRFELAEGGTIFLDEIAETSEAFQIKLLRVLQEGTFERVGGTATKKGNVRVIAATNKDIKQMVEQKQFRDDLFYRLNVLTVQLPPLRDRLEDIPLLVDHIVATEFPSIRSSAAVMHTLQQYSWKGNVRELQSAVKRAALLAKAEERDIMRIKDFPEEIASAAIVSLDIEERIVHSLREKQFSRNAISETADEVGGLNRGTVAEYFRGYCFKVFVEKQCDLAASVRTIAGDGGGNVDERVHKKLQEYIGNAIELVDRRLPLEHSTKESKPKYKNLPQRYHPYLDKIIESYHQRKWSLDRQSNSSKTYKSA